MVVPSISRAFHQARASTILRIRALVLCSLAGMRYAVPADSMSSYASFSDPDGKRQNITARSRQSLHCMTGGLVRSVHGRSRARQHLGGGLCRRWSLHGGIKHVVVSSA